MIESKEDTVTVLILISSMLAQVPSKELTPKLSKLRKQMRIGMSTYIKLVGRSKFLEMANVVNNAWSDMIDTIGEGNDRKVVLSMIMLEAYDYLKDSKYQHMWFSNKTFEAGIRSLSYGFTPSVKDHEDTLWCSTELMGNLGFTRESAFAKKIRLKKKIAEQNRILENG